MQYWVKLVLLCAIALLIQTNLAGELYKWTDEKGVVHYSEKKPDDIEQVKSLELPSTGQFNAAPTAEVQPAPRGLKTSPMVLVYPNNDLFWTLKNPGKKAVTYFFGGDCVSPQSSSLEEMKLNHRWLLTEASSLAYEMERSLERLNYQASTTSQLPSSSSRKNAIIFEFQLADLDYQLCVPEIERQYQRYRNERKGFAASDYSGGDFKHQRATITFDWVVRTGESQSVYYRGTTSGSADFWSYNIDKINKNTLKEAASNALINLIAEEKIQQLLQHANLVSKDYRKPSLNSGAPSPANSIQAIKQQNQTADEVNTSSQVSELKKSSEDNFLDAIGSLFQSSASHKAEFAKVMAGLQPVKIMMVEYYMTNDQWPRSLNDIGISQLDVYEKDFVDGILFDADGSIIVKLSQPRFELDSAVVLTPKVSKNAIKIDWSCRTNLASSYYQSSICQAL